MLPFPLSYLSSLLTRDWSEEWDPAHLADGLPIEPGSELPPAEEEATETPRVFPVVSLERKAASTKYPNGKVKRTRYRPVDLSKRRVIIVVHQAGVERGEARWAKSMHRVSGHRGIGPTGVRYRIHPLRTRLVACNRLDRKKWHACNIELGGNFEGVDGSGRWYKPDVFGRGRAGVAQLEALETEICDIRAEVGELGGRVIGIAPHLVSGRNRKGKPNRQIDPGSLVWSACEAAALKFGLKIPGSGQSFGGLPIYDSWHGESYERLQAEGLVGL